MPFELKTATTAKLATFTARVEKHGEDDVSALSLGLRITGPNTLLDLLSPTLRHALYTEVPGQEPLPGVEPSTPLLRTKDIDSLALTYAFEGWTLSVDHGIDERAPIVMGSTKVDKFKVKALEGGSIELSMRAGSSDVSTDEAGLLFGKMGHEVSITLIAPIPDTAAGVIDGTVEAFERDHPLFDGQEDGAPDATDAFVEQHAPEKAKGRGRAKAEA